MPRANMNALLDFEFNLPPLSEQQRIVEKLDAAFAEIDSALEDTNAQLNLSAQFFRNALNKLFSKLESQYASVLLKEVCDKIQDGAHHSPKNLYSYRDEGLYPYITSKNIRTNFMKKDTIQYTDEDFHHTIYNRCDAKFGDVLLTKDGASTGNVCLNEFDEEISLLSSVCLLRGKEKILVNDYLCYFLQSPIGFRRITGSRTGAAIKRIILKTIKATSIPLPPIEIQIEAIEYASSCLGQARSLNDIYGKKVANLHSLKSAILAQELRSEAV